MLKTDYSGCFSRATVEVLATYLEQPARAGAPVQVSDPSELQEVTVIIGITGDMEGRLMLELSKGCALRLCESMNFGEPFSSLCSLARSTLAEMGNLVAGRAVTMLNDEGSKFSITPPVILCGVGMKASGLLNPTIVPVITEHGTVLVNTAVREHQ